LCGLISRRFPSREEGRRRLIHEAENGSEREQQLLDLLEAVMNDDQEKARIRTALLNERQNAVC
jgi:hypothetical protein